MERIHFTPKTHPAFISHIQNEQYLVVWVYYRYKDGDIPSIDIAQTRYHNGHVDIGGRGIAYFSLFPDQNIADCSYDFLSGIIHSFLPIEPVLSPYEIYQSIEWLHLSKKQAEMLQSASDKVGIGDSLRILDQRSNTTLIKLIDEKLVEYERDASGSIGDWMITGITDRGKAYLLYKEEDK
jgi:hypothetical protein